jgi:hypothetical protein
VDFVHFVFVNVRVNSEALEVTTDGRDHHVPNRKLDVSMVVINLPGHFDPPLRA